MNAGMMVNLNSGMMVHLSTRPAFHQSQPAPLRQERDFPRGDGRYANAVHAPGLLDDRRGVGAEAPVAVNGPHEHMGIQQDQGRADQSEGDAAGANGSS